MPTRLSKIDELTRPDHTFLETGDECYYLGEYTARRGFSFSATNALINNLRKPVARRGRPEWKWKEWAISRSAALLREAMNPAWLEKTTIVPVPPSAVRGSRYFDDRLLRILQEFSRDLRTDFRELVVMTQGVEPSHLSGIRTSIEELIECMAVNDAVSAPTPASIAIFDDVLTTGRHFKAVESVLRARFPGLPIVGIFIARRVPESSPI